MLNTLNLRLEKLSFTKTDFFSSIFLDYLAQKPLLQEFYGSFPSIENFEQVIEERKFPQNHRQVLTSVINEQYDGVEMSGKLIRNIAALKRSNCFTVTTGHQLNIFTGPLYFIYKIVSTINVCVRLKEKYPDHDFVPLYWMASEDHDFAEINHFHLFGKEYRWQSEQDGAVGRFRLRGLESLIALMPECPEFIKEAYTNSDNLAQATRRLVNHLFGDYGLVILDGDQPDLKRLFLPVMQSELLEHHTSKSVWQSSKKIEELGYKTLVTPRKINLFYLTDHMRKRIVKKTKRYEILTTDLSFGEKKMLSLLDQNPQQFSPNVVLRTLYQETVLPNLAYVGGPGELSYWLQFKSSFDHYNIPFPVLFPRNSVLVIGRNLAKKFHKLQLQVDELFLEATSLKNLFLTRNSQNHLDLDRERAEISEAFDHILKKATAVDGSLEGYIKAEETKSLKTLDNIEKRLKKSEEEKQEIAINQLLGLKEKLFPGGNLQERHDNLLNFYLNNPGFIQDMIDHLDPFDFRFHVILDDE